MINRIIFSQIVVMDYLHMHTKALFYDSTLLYPVLMCFETVIEATQAQIDQFIASLISCGNTS